MTSRPWSISREYSERPKARAEAWVYRIELERKFWGLFVDERIRFKTLFEPSSDVHGDLDEVIVPIEGRYWVRVDQWARQLAPGEAALIPRGVSHDSGVATNLVGTRFLVLLFSRELGVLDGVKPGGVSLPDGCLAWLKGAFRFLRHQADETSLLPLTVLPTFVSKLASFPRIAGDARHPDPVVADIIRILGDKESVSLDELSRSVGLTPGHLQRRFKAAVGYSPLEYARALRLESLAAALRAGNSLPLVELAAEHGFNDMKYFRTVFKRRFGCTPAAYRKNAPPAAEPSR